MKNPIKTIHDLLRQYNELIINQRDKGTSFEKLMQSYLELDPLYKERFKKVYMWSEWPHKTTGQDYGIDLVAESYDGEFVAIQCKFYAADYQIQKKDIDSFFTESGKTFQVEGKKKSFSQRIIVSTSDNWSEPAEKSLHGQTIPVIRVHVRELEQSPIDWSKFSLDKPEKLALKEKKKLRPHQEEAITKVIDGFKENDRGKLIMACGTGKTFTALKLAEKITKKDGLVLFLVPSISLLSQTLREWTAESENPFHAFAICSDSKVGKHSEDISRHDLLIPASTDTTSFIKGLEKIKHDKKMTVVFSTYQSIEVVSQAQKKGLPEFDIIICDEAHRTTGATLADKDDSHFVKVHDQKFIKGSKRLYMTATPRIFGDAAKTKAGEAGAELYSMDDVGLFGPEFHRLGFGKAVSEQLLTDYKVLVLAIDESVIDPKFQKQFVDDDQEIPLEDMVKIIGCWNGLSKRFIGEEAGVEDKNPMKRAVAFARSIKDSKQIADTFQKTVQGYINNNPQLENILNCELAHVDGSFNVLDRNAKLDWLKADTEENTCRILTNARCLSEGVDVPALDAVLFLNPRDSMVDVVQSVGRIMRRAEGKKYGYVILPIGIPAGIPPEEALKDNKKYKVVWQVLQALRAHDDRFDAEVNKIELNKNKSSMLRVIGVGRGEGEDKDKDKGSGNPTQIAFNFPEIEEWKDAIYAKIVLKCGSRPYWENWAKDIAQIAEKHSDQIRRLLKSKDEKPKKAFENFLKGIRKNLNPSISEDDAIEMLSQQLITKPVFDVLFEHYKFTESNPVSQSIQTILKTLESGMSIEDTKKLKSFYDSVRMRVRGINNAEARQKIIKELYDNFFNIAFEKMAARLGIVYTPIEVVDFIIQSVEDIMKKEFGKSLSDEGVHILDPFTGTGTFIVRLLQSGIIKPQDLKRKFQNELHANEIVLLAYYIASINIEETYHEIAGGDYIPFNGAVLTDTFQLVEDPEQGSFDGIMSENHKRVESQKKKKISVIIGNPPYSIGQKSANDNAQNQSYPKLDSRITNTYVAQSEAGLNKSLYDAYIKAFRWSTDRLNENSNSGGIICFVSNGAWLDGNSTDGFRKTIEKEFSSIYVFNLRGNARSSGEFRQKEAGNVFGGGSRTPISITLMVKNPDVKTEKASVYYHDIGDYLSREEKLSIITKYRTFAKLPLTTLQPNEYGDWISLRNDSFGSYIPLEPEKKFDTKTKSVFVTESCGIATARDSWVDNYSKDKLISNIKESLQFYNEQSKSYLNEAKISIKLDVKDFVKYDSTKISWTDVLLRDAKKGIEYKFDETALTHCLYRPFCKQNLYFNKNLIHRQYQIPKMFPTPQTDNLVICLEGTGGNKDFACLIANTTPDYGYSGVHTHVFPLYYYEKNIAVQRNLFEGNEEKGFIRRDAVSEFILERAQVQYGKNVTKEDIFYYVYGFLHSKEYRETFANDLKKMLPRLPLVEDVKHFWAFSKAGHKLAELHLNYETVEPSNEVKVTGVESEYYEVEKMRFPKKGEKGTIIYNSLIAVSNIPEKAYEYVVNGKSAIEWVMERYQITTHKESGIVNNPNDWAREQNKPRYILDLLLSIINVSMQTVDIVNDLPKVKF